MEITGYKPGDYKQLISLQNKPKAPKKIDFNWQGHARFMNDKYTIIDKDKMEVPFKQQPAQIDFLYMMGLYYEILILKARKMGFSSDALAIGSTKFLMGENEKCISMSFDQTASDTR